MTTGGWGVVSGTELTGEEKLRRWKEKERMKKREWNATIAGGGRGREKEKIVDAKGA